MMRALALLVLIVAAACTELPEVGAGVCGNGILEANEDCDNPSETCDQCEILCSDNACGKAGYQCGADDVCHAPSGVFETDPRSELPFPVLGFRISDVDFDGYGDVVGLNATALNMRYGDPTGTLPDSYNVVTPSLQGFPALSHLADAEVDDVVLPTADGLVAYTGAFGIPSPRQFPLGGSDSGAAANGPNPYDAVYLHKTIALFGPSSDPAPKLRFSVMTLSSFGPLFEAEITSLCGTTADAVLADWAQHEAVSYQTADATFIAFTYTNTCLLRVRKMPPGSEIARTDPRCPALPGVPLGIQPKCDYEVTSITGASFPRFAKAAVLADLNGDGCPSVISQDDGVGALHEYMGVGDVDSCTISTTPNDLSIREPGSVVIGTVPLVPSVTGLTRDALVTTFGIHAFSTSDDSDARLYTSDRPVLRASVGDVDADGGLDVVLSTFLPNLDIARRVYTQGAFLLVRTPTVGAVEQTVIADFDGDLRDDLGYVENLGSAQRLSIAYGTAAGLAPGIAADAFSQVEFMSPMQVPDSTDPMMLVDDLIVIDITGSGADRHPEITVLHGSPSRTMLSFYGPPVAVPGTSFRAVLAGDFVDGNVGSLGIDSTPYADLVAFQTGLLLDGPTDSTPETVLWLIPGLPNARLGEAVFPATMIRPPTTDQIDTCAAGPKAFCLDFAVFNRWHATPEHDVLLAVDRSPTGAARLLRIDPASIATNTFDAASAITTDLFPAGGRAFDLEVFDIDRDGVPELITSFQPTTLQVDGHVAICPMKQDGTVAGACVDVATDVLMDPSLECVDGVRGNVLPWCTSQGDQLVVLCRKRTGLDITSYVIPLSGAGGVYTGSLADAVVAVPRKLQIMQLADVTGDSVDDLVALDATGGITSLEVYPQLTTREKAVCVGQ
jgi:hypothetical protein